MLRLVCVACLFATLNCGEPLLSLWQKGGCQSSDLPCKTHECGSSPAKALAPRPHNWGKVGAPKAKKVKLLFKSFLRRFKIKHKLKWGKGLRFFNLKLIFRWIRRFVSKIKFSSS